MFLEIAFGSGIHEDCTIALVITSGGPNIGKITCVGIRRTETDKGAIWILTHSRCRWQEDHVRLWTCNYVQNGADRFTSAGHRLFVLHAPPLRPRC
jgi:hypothetical protein